MPRVVVFRLCYVAFPIKRYVARIKKHRIGGEFREAAFIADFFPEDAIVEAVPPRCSIRVRDRFKYFVR